MGEYAISASLPARVCAACGLVLFADRDVETFDARVGALLSEAGIDTPEVLRFLRKVLGLQGKELARLLGVRPETVSRWEQGRAKMTRAGYALLRQLVKDQAEGSRATAEYLRSLEKPRHLKKRMDLSEAA